MKGSNNDLVFIHIIIIDHQMIYGMGWGADGQLGLGQTVDCNVPKALPSLGSPIKKLAGSTDFTLALTGKYFLFIKCVYMYLILTLSLHAYVDQLMADYGHGAILNMDKV